jgi:outer membrane protein assembly factor BamB
MFRIWNSAPHPLEKLMRVFKLLSILLGFFVTVSAVDRDWPQWHGPDRNNISPETGLLKGWPKAGPPTVWSVSGLGRGYGTIAIQGDRLYVQGTQGSESVVFCLSLANGKKIWTRPLGRNLDQDKGGGPRGTPTVEADRVYALSENGDLACLNARDGSVVWTLNILTAFKGPNPKWLISESPLIDGNNLIVTPGGDKAGIVALDKVNGKTVWTAAELSDQAAYSSCIVANVQGVRTIMTLTSGGGVGVRAGDGKLMWRYPRVANRVANVATPVFFNDKVFYTSAYDTGCVLLRLKTDKGLVQTEEAYFSPNMMNHHGGVILVNGHLYGFSNAILTCMEFETGKVCWRDRSVGKGTLTYADGNLYILSEENKVALAEANPSAYVEKGRFEIEDQGWPSWAHPVVHGGNLYIRNQGTLACYNVKAK